MREISPWCTTRLPLLMLIWKTQIPSSCLIRIGNRAVNMQLEAVRYFKRFLLDASASCFLPIAAKISTYLGYFRSDLRSEWKYLPLQCLFELVVLSAPIRSSSKNLPRRNRLCCAIDS